MKYLYTLLPIAIIILAACTNDPKQYQKPENAAMSSVHVPLFSGITGVLRDNFIKTLKPGAIVYLTGDTAVADAVSYVKVTWGDSSAYARADALMKGGQLAVIIASSNFRGISIYSAPSLENEVERIPLGWQLSVVGRSLGEGTPIQYAGMQGQQLLGYVATNEVFTDELNIAFYNAYQEAQRQYQLGDNDALKRLGSDTRYASLKAFESRAFMMGVGASEDTTSNEDSGDNEDYTADSPYAEGDAEYGDYYDPREQMAVEQGWMDDNGVIPDEEIPATIKKFFVFEDGSEMPAEGYSMENKQPSSPDAQPILKDVKKVRFEVTLKGRMNLRFEAETFEGPGSGLNSSFDKDFPDAIPNRPYSITVENTGDNTVILCSVIRVFVKINGMYAISTMSGSCGD